MNDENYKNINKIIDTVYTKLDTQNLWFATNKDNTDKIVVQYYPLDQYENLTNWGKKLVYNDIIDKIGDGAININEAIDLFIQCGLYNNQIIDKTQKTPIYSIKRENFKRRLKEENNKSANTIREIYQSKDFDENSEFGKIVMRTSNLFDVLSDAGYDVQISFDNGESTSSILLGQQGGQVIITINNPVEKLKAFVSGNFEIGVDNIKVLENIVNKIDNI